MGARIDRYNVSDELAKDPFFGHMSEDQRMDAAMALLRARGARADVLDAQVVVRMATNAHNAKAAAAMRREVEKARPATTLVRDILASVPYHHEHLAQTLGCSRQLITMMNSGAARENLSVADRQALARLLQHTRGQIDLLLQRLSA